VTVFDKADKIGGRARCLRRQRPGAPGRPAKRHRLLRRDGEELGVEVRLNTEANAKFMRSVLHEYDVCIVAAAPAPTWRCSVLEGADLLVDARKWRMAASRRERVVMIGGGMIGLTISEFLAKAGHEVTVVEKDKRIAGDIMPTFKWRHTAWVDELGIQTVTLATWSSDQEGATVRRPRRAVHSSTGVIVSSPRKANHTCSRVPVDGGRTARRRRRTVARPRCGDQEGYRLGQDLGGQAISKGGVACLTAPT